MITSTLIVPARASPPTCIDFRAMPLEVLRTRYRDSESEPHWMTPGQPIEIVIPTPLTANRFLRNHRIRIDVTSSFFPHLDRNPNSGETSATLSRLAPARQTVFHDATRPSRVILPIVAE